VSAPLSVSKEQVKLAPVRAKLAGGDLSGDVTVRLKGGFRYTANVGVKGTSVKTLIQEAKSAAGVSGTLQGKATFEGTGGLPTMKGRGEAQVADCKVENAKVMALLSSVLQVPELANPKFDECRLEFTMTGSRVQTPVVSLKGDAMQLTGHGTYNVDTYAIDYDMSLALSAKLLAKVTRKELRPAFKDRGDGFSAVDFRVFGTTLAPQTDLLSRVGKAAASEAAKDQVNKLLKKKKLF
jgi:AsmA-like C-terminal region